MTTRRLICSAVVGTALLCAGCQTGPTDDGQHALHVASAVAVEIDAALPPPSCVGTPAEVPSQRTPSLKLAPVASGLGSAVTAIVSAGPGRLLVATQKGLVRLIDDGVLRPNPVLDVRSLVKNGGEQGLLGLALSPTFETDRRFYVMYSPVTSDPSIVISRFLISASDGNVAAPGSETKLLVINKSLTNHNGGQLAFGPDGLLYVGVGDGGGAGDPERNAQNKAVLLGKVLRLDVSGSTYAIPPTNPFVTTSGARGEIWAYGLRNPWRFSFDRATGDLYLPDLGQSSREELNFEPAGGSGGRNYGWNMFEGSQCFRGAQSCSPEGKVPPVHEYAASRHAIIGGYVYRGCELPLAAGTYVFGDFGAADVRALQMSGGAATNVRTLITNMAAAPTTFGEDAQGEIYVGTVAGTVSKLATN